MRFGGRHVFGIAVLAAVALVVWWPRGAGGGGEVIDAGRGSALARADAGDLRATDVPADARRAVEDEIEAAEDDAPAALARAALPPELAPGAEIAGIVTTMSDVPLAGVTLRSVDGKDGVMRQATSDADGRFTLGALTYPREIDAELEGWTQVATPTPQTTSTRQYRPVHVVMTRTGTLEVAIVDADGAPVVGHGAYVDVSPAEVHGRKESGHRSHQPPRRTGTAGNDGVLVLEDVPAECRLRLSVDREREWVRGDELCDRGPGAVPLVLEPGERRRVVARAGARVRIGGVVLEPGGSPSPGARVTVRALDVVDGFDGLEQGRPNYVGSATTDEDGRFALEATTAGSPRRVLVYAESTVGEEPSLSPFGGAKPPDPLCAAWREIDFASGPATRTDLVLQVAPLAKLTGKVVDEAGEGVSARVTVTPEDGAPLVDRSISGRLFERGTGGNGDFRFIGLRRGAYTVTATTSDGRSARAESIAADTPDLTLTLERGTPATVHVAVDASVPLDEVIVLCTRLEPLPGVGDDAPALPEDADYSEPFGWPAPALGLWYGGQTYQGPLGRAMFSSSPVEGGARTYELSPGLYWIGAKARGADGSQCFPIGTGLVRVNGGEHRVRFHLSPAGSIEGLVRDADPRTGPCVALATTDGRLVPVDARRDDMQPVQDLSASGRFSIGSAPAGTFEVRVGTLEEVTGGYAPVRRVVEVRAGETARVEL